MIYTASKWLIVEGIERCQMQLWASKGRKKNDSAWDLTAKSSLSNVSISNCTIGQGRQLLRTVYLSWSEKSTTQNILDVAAKVPVVDWKGKEVTQVIIAIVDHFSLPY